MSADNETREAIATTRKGGAMKPRKRRRLYPLGAGDPVTSQLRHMVATVEKMIAEHGGKPGHERMPQFLAGLREIIAERKPIDDALKGEAAYRRALWPL